MGDITRQPIGMKTKKWCRVSKKNYTFKVSNISQINTEAETANMHTLPRGAKVKGTNTEALWRKPTPTTSKGEET